MPSVKLWEGVYSVGALNPNMRVFDIVMRTEYGTTYNSYIIKGGSKTALVEGCHKTFHRQFLQNIQEICPLEEIDTIILNHNEPDHSGAVAEVLARNPKAEIFCTQAGALYIKGITNLSDLNIHVVKDGETLSLGGKTFRFLVAPFLHWPDSMFAYLEEDKALFSCDFLGCHYCEPYTFDYNTTKPAAYEKALKEYYDAIFGPFPTYVRKGLDKIQNLSIDYICPSHGPILTKDGKISYALKQYAQWCAPQPDDTLEIPIFYCSAYGNTRMLAEQIAQGILEVLPQARTEVFDIIEHDMGELASRLNRSTAFAIGSPTINRDAVAPVWQLLSHVDAVNSGKKPALIFGSYGWSGEAAANIKARLEGLKMKVFGEGFKVVFVPNEENLRNARSLGREFAQSI